MHEINEALLSDPKSKHEKEKYYLGRGCFGIVKLQLYRGIYVAVKEFLPHSVKDDVKNEARLLAQLCHPYLPYLFGVTLLKVSPIVLSCNFMGSLIILIHFLSLYIVSYINKN